jgi:hypothetical protein
MTLLEKVEELTLYIIQQQKEIDALKEAMQKNNINRFHICANETINYEKIFILTEAYFAPCYACTCSYDDILPENPCVLIKMR